MELEQDEGMLSTAPSGAVEVPLINEELWRVIRAEHERGVPKKTIARNLGLDIKTVRKWCNRSYVPQHRRARGKQVSSFEAFLRHRAPEVGFNAAVLHRELRGLGFRGCYASVAGYISAWREKQGGVEPTLRFETGPGEQAQVDWGTLRVYLGEEVERVHIFAMVLGYSRRLFAKAFVSEGLDPLCEGHAAAFAHFGGCTQTILYDNPRTIVTSKQGKAIHWNPTFKDRMEHYGFEARLCQYYRAQTKGKIESSIKYIKCNALAGRRFEDLEDLNRWLVQWCAQVADQRIHGTTKERPAVLFEAERSKLRPVDGRAPAPREKVHQQMAQRDGFVAVESNRYPVPFSWAGRLVAVSVRSDEIVLTQGELSVCYERLSGKHQVARWSGAPRELPVRQRLHQLDGPPQYDPVYLMLGDVEQRPLEQYAALAAGVVR